MYLYPENLTGKIGFEPIREAALKACRSVMGRERLANLQPQTDRGNIRQLLEETGEMMRLLREESGFPLNNLHDIRKPVEKSRPEASILTAEEFLDILEISITARRVKAYINDRKDSYPKLAGISTSLVPLNDLEDLIAGIIDEKAELRNDASRELKSIRNRLGNKKSELRNTINRVMNRVSKQGMASDEGPTLRNGRMVIPIQVKYKRKVQGFVHDVSSSGQTVYLEPVEALNINNEIRQLESEEQREIERILRELTDAVRASGDSLLKNVNVLGRIDAIAARAYLSDRMDGYIPVLSETSHLYLKEAYNPVLLLKNMALDKEEREPVIPLDMELNKEEHCLVITGPNAGGKSVAMKTLALCVMMMQSGFAVPARDSSEIPVFKSLFVDMGDDQSIENDLSTFSSRLEWMKNTMQHAAEKSLVLIDEAAAGTDPEEGGALFQALIENLMDRNAKIIVTTHHGSLKVFAHEHPNAVNGSMEFDQESLSPTYRFKKGVPGSSYAFEIAGRMELDKDLLDNARTLLGEAKSDLEQLITELESKTQEAEELKEKFNRLKSKMESERHKYEEKRSAIERDKEKIREKALKQAKEIMQSANRRIEEAVEQVVKPGEKDSEAIKEARRKVDNQKKEIQKELEEVEQRREQRKQDAKEPPEVGDTVRLEDANTTGELVELNNNTAIVLAGGLRLKTRYSNLVKVADKKDTKNDKQRIKVNVMSGDRPGGVKPRLDIRGYRGPEAVKELTHYLDNAVASGLTNLEIVHGKGEGILKSLVHEHLGERKEVKSFDIAPADQGGAGCTLVELK